MTKVSLIILAAGIACVPATFVGQSTTPRRTPAATQPTTDPAIPRGSSSGTFNTAAPKQTGPQLSREEQERFLATARIVNQRQLAEGTTRTWRVTLTDGQLTHDAHVQTIDIYKPLFRGKEGTVEKDFRDSWKYNVAAYRIDKLLNLNMVPSTVHRIFDGKLGSFTWWVDDVWMDEATRRDKAVKPPTADFWTNQLNKIRVFDQLIANADRNQGNLLIQHDWRVWIIDHSRAFRTTHALLKPDSLNRCDKTLLERMAKLDVGALKLAVSDFLTPQELEAVLARRDVIVNFFNSEIREKGEDAVLTGIPRSTPQVSVP